MTRSPRIAFIGAGSVEFTRQLVGDLLSYPELREVTLSLHDIDEERLATAAAVARVTALEAGAEPAIEAHEDRRRALDGADYAINMIQVGGHAATVLDHEIPIALRTAPDDRRHARHRRHLPGAADDPGDAGNRGRHGRCLPGRLAAQLHQPDGDAVLGDLRRHAAAAGRRPLPLGPEHDARSSPSYVGVPFEEVTFLGAGVNHQAWILRFERDGENLYPLLDEAIERDPELRRHGAGRAVPTARLLPDRVERALGRVPALAHARRRRRSSASGS